MTSLLYLVPSPSQFLLLQIGLRREFESLSSELFSVHAKRSIPSPLVLTRKTYTTAEYCAQRFAMLKHHVVDSILSPCLSAQFCNHFEQSRTHDGIYSPKVLSSCITLFLAPVPGGGRDTACISHRDSHEEGAFGIFLALFAFPADMTGLDLVRQ